MIKSPSFIISNCINHFNTLNFFCQLHLIIVNSHLQIFTEYF